MKKILDYLLRAAIVGACLFYLYHEVDWPVFIEAMKTFSLLPILCVAAISFVQYILTGLRLDFLTGHRAGFGVSFKATLFCLGMNNIIPAKMGEVAKAFYLRKQASIPLGEGLGMIFWERFFDLNCLLVLGLIAAVLLGMELIIWPLAAMVGVIWAGVVIFRIFPTVPRFVSRFIPWERVRLLFMDVVHQLQDKADPKMFLALSLWSMIVWASFVGVTALAIYWIGDLGLSPAQTLMVFVGASLGFALPSSPGGLGVYETAFVGVLKLLGFSSQAQSQGLALALVIHAIIFIPPILSAIYVMSESGLNMKTIRERSEETL